MVAAAQSLAKIGGGLCAVENGKLLAVLELPIAGLISPLESPELIKCQRELLIAVAQLGCPIHDPFMPLSFLALPVIPKLKITDLGLVDVERFQVVSLFV